MGLFINHVVKFLRIFDSPPPSWPILLNKAYVIKLSFGKSPPSSNVQGVYRCTLKLELQQVVWNVMALGEVTLFNREQLIAGAVLGEVFLFFFFSTYLTALKLCIIQYVKAEMNP